MTDVRNTQTTLDTQATPNAEATTLNAETTTPNVETTTPNAETTTPNAETTTPNAETTTPNAETRQSAATPPSNPDLAEKAGPLGDLIASIRAAVVPGVSADVRAVGAAACRAILTALEAQVGHPLAAAAAAPTPPTPLTSSTSPLAGMLSHLAAMPREQLIEFLLGRLRNALPPGTPTQPTAGPRFHIVTLPPAGRR
jgi:hypothetical protein